MIRWYALLPDAERLVSPISAAPYVFDAPAKLEAFAYCARVWPEKWLAPMSVCEYEAAAEMKSAAQRAKAYDDALLAYARTLPVPEEYDLDEQQMSLCRDGAFWAAA